MSVESMAVVLHHSPAKGTDKLILLGIANHDGDGGAWPSVATLAKYANIDTRGVQKVLARLEQSGQITRYVQEGGTLAMRNGQRPNRYVINVVCPTDCDRTTAHRTPVRADTPVPADTPTGVRTATRTPVRADTQTILEPSSEPSGSGALRAPTADPVETSSSNVTSGSTSARDNAAAAMTSPEARGDATRATPGDILEAMMLSPDDAERFRAWLVTGTGSTNPGGLIVTLHGTGRLSERIVQWRTATAFAGPSAAPLVALANQPGHLAWCGRCDAATRTLAAFDAEGHEYVRRCPSCNVNAGHAAAGSGAAQEIAVTAASVDRTPGAGREAFLAARAALPAGAQRRTTAIGTPLDVATVRATQDGAL
jgi:helix-turn-helix protein